MNTTVDARPMAGNGVEKETLLDNRLEALLSRMDRLAASVEKSGVTIYQRRLNTSDIANPAPIGLFAFALATAFYMTSQESFGSNPNTTANFAHITEQSSQFIAFPLGMFLGGLAMFVAGFIELWRKNSLGATAFTVYGSFWITVGVYGTIRAAGIFFLEAPEGEQALTALMGMASFVFMIVSFAANWSLPFLFFNLTVMFFLLAGGMKNTTCARVAGWWGIWTSFLAFYCGAASLFKDMWGMDVLPQRFTKVYDKTSRVLFPRAQVDPETGDIEDGGILKKH